MMPCGMVFCSLLSITRLSCILARRPILLPSTSSSDMPGKRLVISESSCGKGGEQSEVRARAGAGGLTLPCPGTVPLQG